MQRLFGRMATTNKKIEGKYLFDIKREKIVKTYDETFNLYVQTLFRNSNQKEKNRENAMKNCKIFSWFKKYVQI